MERAAASSEPLLDQQKAATPPWHRFIPATPLAALLCVASVLLGVGCAGWAVTQWLLTGAGSDSACGDRDSCLRIVDAMLANQPRQTFFTDPKVGLMQTFGPNSVGGGPCGSELCELVEPCPNYAQTPHCRFDTYDNALAAIYLSKRGDFDGARRILDAFIGLLYPAHSMPGITIDPKVAMGLEPTQPRGTHAPASHPLELDSHHQPEGRPAFQPLNRTARRRLHRRPDYSRHVRWRGCG